MRGKTDLYRMFDADGALLYIGISLSAVMRMGGHRSSQPWWDDVVRVDIEKFKTRKQAETAEFAAIQQENPKHNVMLRKKPESYGPPSPGRVIAVIAEGVDVRGLGCATEVRTGRYSGAYFDVRENILDVAQRGDLVYLHRSVGREIGLLENTLGYRGLYTTRTIKDVRRVQRGGEPFPVARRPAGPQRQGAPKKFDPTDEQIEEVLVKYWNPRTVKNRAGVSIGECVTTAQEYLGPGVNVGHIKYWAKQKVGHQSRKGVDWRDVFPERVKRVTAKPKS